MMAGGRIWSPGAGAACAWTGAIRVEMADTVADAAGGNCGAIADPMPPATMIPGPLEPATIPVAFASRNPGRSVGTAGGTTVYGAGAAWNGASAVGVDATNGAEAVLGADGAAGARTTTGATGAMGADVAAWARTTTGTAALLWADGTVWARTAAGAVPVAVTVTGGGTGCCTA